jgi:hypothetical protein
MKVNGTVRTISIIVGFIMLVATLIWNARGICKDVEINTNTLNTVTEKQVPKIEDDINMAEAERHMMNEAIIKLQSDVSYIKEGIDDIKVELRER